MESIAQNFSDEVDCLDLNERDISAFENCISDGYNSFIEKCSNSIYKNKSNYSSEDIKKFLYVFKFLNDQWSITNRDIRSIKKNVLQALFLSLLSKKSIEDKNLLINKLVTSIGNNWHFHESEFPYLVEEEKQQIINLLSVSNLQDVESRFTNLNFSEKISSSEILQLFPDFLGEIKKTFSDFRQHMDDYDDENCLLIKSIFTCIVDATIRTSYPGIIIILPLCYFLNKINSMNNEILKISSKVYSTNQISFNDSDPCYITERLHIKNDSGRYLPIPNWAIWFFKVGEKMASFDKKNKNIVLGFSLPTKSYAALFFLLGYETRIAIQSMSCKEIDSEHFLRITGSERKTPLLVWDNNRWKRCFAKGFETIYGQEMFSVIVPGSENKKHKRLVSKEHSYIFREAVHPERKVGDHQVGYAMRGFDFYKSYYEKKDEDLLKYLITSEFRYTVIGNKTNFKNEIDELSINLRTSKGWLEGSIMDIIRLDNYLLSEYDLSRGIMLSSEAINKYNSRSDLLIFDGTLPFLKHFDDLEGTTKVIFLDRNEPQFAEACRVIMEQNYSDRGNEEDLILYDSIPETIEAIIFEE